MYVVDILTEILLKLDPPSVINLSQVDKTICAIYDTENIFHQLMISHYPHSLITDNPKRQYLSLVHDIKTKYCTLINYNTESYITDTNYNEINILKIFLDEVYIRDAKGKKLYYHKDKLYFEHTLNFEIKGSHTVNDDVYWLQVKIANSIMTAIPFLTKETAINDFLDKHYDNEIIRIINVFFDESNYKNCDRNDIEAILNLDFFNAYLYCRYYPTNLHRSSLFDYIMKNSFYASHPDEPFDDGMVIYQFVKVTINNRYMI